MKLLSFGPSFWIKCDPQQKSLMRYGVLGQVQKLGDRGVALGAHEGALSVGPRLP
jgi:hypothetical protein